MITSNPVIYTHHIFFICLKGGINKYEQNPTTIKTEALTDSECQLKSNKKLFMRQSCAAGGKDPTALLCFSITRFF